MSFNLSVKHSLITAESVFHFLSHYHLPEVLGCDFFTRGLNDTYLVTTRNEKYIFRIYRHGWRDKSDILFELDAIHHLKKEGYSLSVPVPKRNGDLLCDIAVPEGLRYGVLFTFTKGDRPEIHPDHCRQIGQALGNLHNKSIAFGSDHKRNFDLDLKHLLDDPASLILPTIKRILSDRQIQEFNETVESVKKDLVHRKLEYGFCHGDFHNFNMHVKDRQIEAFDFDCCGHGYRSYDLAVFWWNLKKNYSALEKSCWDHFLNGYLSQRSLSEDDLKSLPQLVTARRIWFMGILLKNDDVWGTHWVNEINFSNFINQLKEDKENW